MRAHMDHRIALFDAAQPQIKRDVTMPRRAPEVVILRGAIGAPAAIRLHRDQYAAATNNLENKIAVVDRGIAFGWTPLRFQVGCQR